MTKGMNETDSGRNDLPKQEQSGSGLQSKMIPIPDDGSKSYIGHNRLQDKRALITGGDSGIGRSVAIAYAHEGADVVLNYLPDEESDAQDVKESVNKLGRRILLVPGDLREESFSQELVAHAVSFFGAFDILVLVAGKQHAVFNIEDLSTDQLVDTYTTNVFSIIWLIKAALPHLNENGSIITTSSVQAKKPLPYLVDYASTKAAIRNITESLAKQLAPRHIRVNCVAPGPIWTPLQIAGGQPQEKIPDLGKNTAMGRPGQPVEVAGTYVYLASADTTYVTGETVYVTGG